MRAVLGSMRIATSGFALLLVATPASALRQHKTHAVQQGDTVREIARSFGLTDQELMQYNALKPEDALAVGAKLTIPFPGEVGGAEHEVRKGDSVAKVADYYGVAQDDLLEANGLRKGSALKLGQKLRIPKLKRGGAASSVKVKQGDTIASIAERVKVEAGALARANKIAKGEALAVGRTLIVPDVPTDVPARYQRGETVAPSEQKVVSGKKVNGGVIHVVQQGQSWAQIAQAYGTGPKALARANKREVEKPLRPGTKLFIPGAEEAPPLAVKAGSGFPVVHFVRVWNAEQADLALIGPNGQVDEKAREQLSELARPREGTKTKRLLHPRLIHMLQRVVDHYPGRTIEVISGYRPGETGFENKHSEGRALDFRVGGVSNKDVYKFIKQLPNVGAGYYPNSVFVHLDVRDKPTTWVDRSPPRHPLPRQQKTNSPMAAR